VEDLAGHSKTLEPMQFQGLAMTLHYEIAISEKRCATTVFGVWIISFLLLLKMGDAFRTPDRYKLIRDIKNLYS